MQIWTIGARSLILFLHWLRIWKTKLPVQTLGQRSQKKVSFSILCLGIHYFHGSKKSSYLSLKFSSEPNWNCLTWKRKENLAVKWLSFKKSNENSWNKNCCLFFWLAIFSSTKVSSFAGILKYFVKNLGCFTATDTGIRILFIEKRS